MNTFMMTTQQMFWGTLYTAASIITLFAIALCVLAICLGVRALWYVWTRINEENAIERQRRAQQANVVSKPPQSKSVAVPRARED